MAKRILLSWNNPSQPFDDMPKLQGLSFPKSGGLKQVLISLQNQSLLFTVLCFLSNLPRVDIPDICQVTSHVPQLLEMVSGPQTATLCLCSELAFVECACMARMSTQSPALLPRVECKHLKLIKGVFIWQFYVPPTTASLFPEPPLLCFSLTASLSWGEASPTDLPSQPS